MAIPRSGAPAAAAATAGAAGGQLLAGLGQHRFHVLTGTHDTHDGMLAADWGFRQQQGRMKTHPAIDLFLELIHGHSEQLRIGSTGRRSGLTRWSHVAGLQLHERTVDPVLRRSQASR